MKTFPLKTVHNHEFIRIPVLVFSICFSLIQSIAQVSDMLEIKPRTNITPQFEPLYIDVFSDKKVDNPFDPDQINLFCIVRIPSGKVLIIPGFFMGVVQKKQHWQVRYAPMETGTHSYRIECISGQDTIISNTYDLKVMPSPGKGFVRADKGSYFSFKFDNGEPFRGIGMNLCWTDNYEYYFKKLQDSGCNFIRVWMCPWNLSLEWTQPGLGRYNLQEAEKLDQLLALAEKYGIYIMLCLDYHGATRKDVGYFKENRWRENPYNQINGGSCHEAADFFTNPMAKSIYKKRLRYLVGRYSYSTVIQSWEFWNEVDLTAGEPKDVITWHQEMADFLKRLDPHQHLVTSSVSYDRYPELWNVKNLDFSQVHIYNAPDMPVAISQAIRLHTSSFLKPHVVGEYGIDYRGPEQTREYDPDNVGFHNGLWIGLLCPTPILPMSWWWDSVIDPGNLYTHFDALNRYWQGVPSKDTPIKKTEVFISTAGARWVDENSTRSNLVLAPTLPWGKSSVSTFSIESSGQVQNEAEIPGFLFSPERPDLHNFVEFKIPYLQDGEFAVHVYNQSDDGQLKILIDGQLSLDQTLPLDPKGGGYEKIEWMEQYQRYQGLINKTYAVKIPAGWHTIRVENGGKDWMEIAAYRFINCGFSAPLSLDAYALTSGFQTLVWLRNINYSWRKVKLSGLPGVIRGASLILPEVSPGTYQIEWWDTYSGKIIFQNRQQVITQTALVVIVPDIQRDLALKVKAIRAN